MKDILPVEITGLDMSQVQALSSSDEKNKFILKCIFKDLSVTKVTFTNKEERDAMYLDIQSRMGIEPQKKGLHRNAGRS